MAHRIIRSLAEFEEFVRLGRTLKWPQTLRWNPGADRSLDQNALQSKWAQEAGDQLGLSVEEIRCQWKLNHGIPILCADSEEYRSFCTLTLKPLTYEQRVKAMRYTPVTSEMTVKQMTQYLDTVQRECAEQGIRLTDPDAKRKAA